MAILNVLPSESGQVITNGKIGYVSEESWIFSDTVRENILFGMEMSPTWYNKVIHACALGKVNITRYLLFIPKEMYSTEILVVKSLYELVNSSKNNHDHCNCKR